ncbi:MAG: hypothetical protein ACRDP9_04805 [Kribbellaceae bacterium]
MNSIEHLRSNDPAAGIADGPLDARALADLDRVMSPQRPRRIGVRRRTALIAAGVGIFAVGATLGVPLIGGERTAAPAYAVQRNDDGTVSVRIERFEDADGLEAAIERYGVNAEVDYLPYGKTCREPRYTVAPTADQSAAVSVGDQDGSSILLTPGDFDSNETLVIMHSSAQQAGVEGRVIQQLIAEGPVAPCDPVDLPR